MDGLADGRFGSDHRLDVEAGHELDVVHREDVGGIGHRDRQRGTDARERHDLIADRRLLGDQLDHCGIDFVKLQIDGRNAVLAGKHRGDVVVADEPELHQAGSQPAAALLLVFERLLQLIRGDQAVLNQNFAKSRRHECRLVAGHSTRTALKWQPSTRSRRKK